MEIPGLGATPAGALGAHVGGEPANPGIPAFTHNDRGSPRTPVPSRLPGFTAAGRPRAVTSSKSKF